MVRQAAGLTKRAETTGINMTPQDDPLLWPFSGAQMVLETWLSWLGKQPEPPRSEPDEAALPGEIAQLHGGELERNPVRSRPGQGHFVPLVPRRLRLLAEPGKPGIHHHLRAAEGPKQRIVLRGHAGSARLVRPGVTKPLAVPSIPPANPSSHPFTAGSPGLDFGQKDATPVELAFNANIHCVSGVNVTRCTRVLFLKNRDDWHAISSQRRPPAFGSQPSARACAGYLSRGIQSFFRRASRRCATGGDCAPHSLGRRQTNLSKGRRPVGAAVRTLKRVDA